MLHQNITLACQEVIPAYLFVSANQLESHWYLNTTPFPVRFLLFFTRTKKFVGSISGYIVIFCAAAQLCPCIWGAFVYVIPFIIVIINICYLYCLS